MSELYFRVGEMKGFTAIDLADKKEGYANPIRELMQNSLDASREAGNSECKINIYIETIPKSDIPHIKDYERALRQAIKTHKSGGSFNANSEQVVKSIERALNEQNITVLMFSDNGTGMPPKQTDAILTGLSIKGDEKSGGSFGVGNLSSYSLSSLRYVLYATKFNGKNGATSTLFTGSPILAGHRDADDSSQRVNRGRIVKEIPNNETNPEFDYPEEFPKFIQPKIDNIDTGTVVVMLGLSEPWGEDAEYAIVSNFFHTISYSSTIINVYKENEEPVHINDEKVKCLIENQKDVKRAMGENILSGQAVHQAWQAVMANGQKNVTLKNGDNVHLYIKTNSESDSTIALIRNGMLIARHDSMLSNDMKGLRKNPNFENFTAVIDVDQEDAPKLFALVKGAESPYHNKLEKDRLDPKKEKILKGLFKELSEKMETHLDKVNRDSVVLPLFPTPEQVAVQINEAKPQATPISPPRKKKRKGKKKGTKRQKPNVVSRSLESQNAVRYKEQNGMWEVYLRITPKNNIDPKDDAYLTMCLGEDDDRDAARTYLNFMSAEMNGTSVSINSDNKTQINLGPLNKGETYNITADVEKPNQIGVMKVALLPILGLKQRRGSNETSEE